MCGAENIVSIIFISAVWRLVPDIPHSLSFSRQSIQISPFASSCGLLFLFSMATNLHMPLFSAFPANVISRNFAFLSHVIRFITPPTFANKAMLSTLPLTARGFTTLFAGPIDFFFAHKNNYFFGMTRALDIQ